jgi:hypothetical protein
MKVWMAEVWYYFIIIVSFPRLTQRISLADEDGCGFYRYKSRRHLWMEQT